MSLVLSRRIPWRCRELQSAVSSIAAVHQGTSASSSPNPRQTIHAFSGAWKKCIQTYYPTDLSLCASRRWAREPKRKVRDFSTSQIRKNTYDDKAKDLNQKSLDEQEQQTRARKNQVKRPWLREGADRPPGDQADEQAEPPTKGKLLTTPTRLLKLILPLPVDIEKDTTNNGRDYGRAVSANSRIQPLALLVHPQQPLSYVERLIQAELPPVIEDGKEKIPNIYFRGEDTEDSEKGPRAAESLDADQTEDTGASGGRPQDGSPANVSAYSGLGHEGPERAQSEKKWVRWSSSTEMGDFIRDAARGREFVVEIEGLGAEVRVSVPSFRDRTHYLRLRLRKMSREIDALAAIKRECDIEAHRSAHRLAQGGLLLLAGWWGIVYYMTFQTEWGWDLVEPVTYLVGLSTIMAGYLWFLYINRDVSYKSAMNITVSRRQNALYEARGFDIHKWESLIQEATALRKEIKTVAAEYDVDWDETKDVGEDVKKVLDKEKRKRNNKSNVTDEDMDEEEEEDDMEDDKGKSNDKKS